VPWHPVSPFGDKRNHRTTIDAWEAVVRANRPPPTATVPAMGRHPTRVSSLQTGYRGGPRWSDAYHCEWSTVVGDRVRRLRNARGLSLAALADLVYKPEGGNYSAGYFSRLERGWASAPMYVYLGIAAVLEVEAGRLLGSDDAQKPITEAEMTLVRFLRGADLPPHEVLMRIARPSTP